MEKLRLSLLEVISSPLASLQEVDEAVGLLYEVEAIIYPPIWEGDDDDFIFLTEHE